MTTERKADDAARRLRGESCANCDAYSMLGGKCWSAPARVTRQANAWCPEWRSEQLKGRPQDLDDQAAALEYTRLLGENDDQLRTRIRLAFK